MKRSLLILFISLFVLEAFAQKPYSVEGVFKCKYDGIVYLRRGIEIDSTLVRDGKFKFNGAVKLPVESYILVKSNKNLGLNPFYIEGGKVFLEVDTATKKIRDDKPEVLEVLVKTSKKSKTQKIIDSLSYLISNKTSKIKDEEEKNKETKELVIRFMLTESNSVATADVLSGNVKSFSREELKDLYEKLDPEIKANNSGRWIFNATLKPIPELPVVIGEKLPDFSQNDANGKAISIQSLRGKYVLIDFWASWCVACRQENPMVVKAYQHYRDKGLEILSVSLDDKKELWLKAIRDDNLTWLHVSDLNGWNNEVSKTFGIKSIPDNILIDKEGKVLARSLRGEDLEKKLQEIFSKEADK